MSFWLNEPRYLAMCLVRKQIPVVKGLVFRVRRGLFVGVRKELRVCSAVS